MSKKRNNIESMICLTPKPSQINFFLEKDLFQEKWEWRIEQKIKKGFLTGLVTAIKDSTTSIRKHAN